MDTLVFPPCYFLSFRRRTWLHRPKSRSHFVLLVSLSENALCPPVTTFSRIGAGPSLAFAFIKFFHPRNASLLHDASTNLKPHYPPVGIAFQPGETIHDEDPGRFPNVTRNASYENKGELYHHLGPLLIRGCLDNNPKWADPADRIPRPRALVSAASLADSNHTSLPNRNKV
ncbi:hypothetical protein EDB84DRAFT_873495 [Lactarius hengduanensis]|nr:hypothetical protein EDB84DRAFT_873495 [Lactarius hengduanensis]